MHISLWRQRSFLPMKTYTAHISEHFLTHLAVHLRGIFFCAENSDQFSLSYISTNCKALTGYEQKELLDGGLLFIIDLADRESVKEKKQLAFSKHKACNIEYRIITKDGKMKWVNEICSPVLDDEGKLTHIEGYIRELHEKYDFSTLSKTFNALQDAVNRSSVVTICNKEGLITYANQLFCEDMEYTTKEIVGKDHRLVNSGVHETLFFKDLWDTILNGKIWRGEICNLSKTGKLFWYDTIITPLMDKHNQVVQFLSLRNNITEKKNFEKTIRESEERLRKNEESYLELIENSKEFIFRVDIHSRLILSNNYLQKALGRGARELEGLSLFEIIHPKYHQACISHFKEALSGNKHSNVELVFLNRTKKKIYVEGNSTPIVSETKTIGLQCFFRDVTERKKAELELVKSQQGYKNVVDHINDAIVVRDIRGRITFANQRFLDMLGKQTKDLATILADDYIAPGWQAEVQKLYFGFMQSERDTQTFEYQGRHSDGSLVWLEDSITLLFEDGEKAGTQSVIRDITEVKRKENDLKKLINELTNRNNEMMQFNYIVSHNLRAPIANIIGLCNIIGHGNIKDSEKQQILEHIRSSSIKIDEIIKDLSLVLNTRTNLNAKKEQVNFKKIVRSIVETLEDQIILSNCRLVLDISKEANEVFSIKSYMESILFNLISNAIKYRSPHRDPIVTVKIQRIPEALQITVTDNGMGINLNENGAYMFGLYKRFNYTVEGKGLGLHMTKTQVESLNGKISVVSEENKGSVFTIEIPDSQLKEYS
jgi:PAS domain S-box-containing protein